MLPSFFLCVQKMASDLATQRAISCVRGERLASCTGTCTLGGERATRRPSAPSRGQLSLTLEAIRNGGVVN